MSTARKTIKYDEENSALDQYNASRNIQDAAARYNLESEGRFSRIETTLVLVADNLKDTTDTIKGLTEKHSDIAAELAALKTQMSVIRWIGSAVGLAVIGLVLETLYLIVKAI